MIKEHTHREREREHTHRERELMGKDNKKEWVEGLCYSLMMNLATIRPALLALPCIVLCIIIIAMIIMIVCVSACLDS